MNDNIFTRARSVGIESVLEKVIEHFNVFCLPQHIQLWLDNDVNDWLVATK